MFQTMVVLAVLMLAPILDMRRLQLFETRENLRNLSMADTLSNGIAALIYRRIPSRHIGMLLAKRTCL
ncbi:MAG: hypothetical protein A3H35_07625 [Betaproteobacteria bacterium RIFCSPLOWO2_02_FULL_62_17]|nr:MAG: hypothetical protein A3H35_07625 [Betaproteobacteria bacterium RIFCSPLOWO2_02_FULL_62_17]